MRWQRFSPAPASHLRRFSEAAPELAGDPVLLQVLYNRGIVDPAEADAFLAYRNPQSDDPGLLSGMDAAVGRLTQAIRSGEPIAIYGDYDADGVTGAVLLTQALRAMGAERVQPYIPHRVEEGYGLNSDALEQLASKGSHLVVTVDCGIREVEQVRHANGLGLEVIVTDHHAPGRELPPALAIVDPRQPGDCYPDRDLAGCGIALKLVQALVLSGLPMRGIDETDLLDLVALGTVADLVPLIGENRSLVYRGMQVIRQGRRPGLVALLKAAGIRASQINATTLGFGLGPRINAAGRMDHAYHAAKLLITRNPAKADEQACLLNQLNRQRQEKTRRLAVQAEEIALREGREPHLVFAAHADFPPGLVGLIASQLQETHYRPAVAVQIRGNRAVGSCRSIPEFHITEALDQCGDLLEKHGGHAAAAGFTIRAELLPQLRERLSGIAQEQLAGRDLTPTLQIDEELKVRDIIWEVHESLARLEPCGYGNPSPLFLSPAVRVSNCRPVGTDGAHLKLLLEQDGRTFDAIAFRMGNRAGQLREHMDIVYRLEEHEWNGESNLQLNIQDMRPAQQPPLPLLV